MPATIVVVQSIGQLGNRLFQFSHLIALAKARGCRVLNPAFWKYAPLFPSTQQNLFCSFPEQQSNWVQNWMQALVYYFLRLSFSLGILNWVPNSFVFKKDWRDGPTAIDSEAFTEIVKKFRIVFLVGSYKHKHRQGFALSWPYVRAFFRVSEETKSKIKSHLESLRESSDILVGVHLRQGDVFTDPVRRDGLDQSVYAQKLAEFLLIFPEKNVSFLICSNEPIMKALFSTYNHKLGLGDFLDDLYSLAECDYLLGAGQSSFSLWASKIGSVPRAGLFQGQDSNLRLNDFKLDFSE
jgi:hypothetical protein